MHISVSARPQVQRALILAPLLAVLALSMGTIVAGNDAELLRATVIFSVLALVSFVVFWVVSRSDPEGSTLYLLLLASFGLKIMAMAFRFNTGLLADSYAYDDVGRRIAEELARGQWPENLGAFGTAFIRLVTGLAYYVLGVTHYGVSTLWSWFGLLGLLFFYLAFRTAFPEGNKRLYMFLIFLYPSTLLWTSSLGKDALMVMFLGMAAYGAARMQHRLEPIGLWWLALGVAGAFMIRPHLASVFMVALGASTLIRPIRAGLLTPIVRLGGLITVGAISIALIGTASGYVGLEGLEAGEVSGFIRASQERSAQGGSAFEQEDPRTPEGFAMAIPTVLFRPFLWEAHNLNALIASLEGVGLLALMIFRWRSVGAALLATFRNSYMLLVGVFAVLFIIFFSAIGNFGIIVRERASQLYPFVFMWIAYLGPRAGDRTAGGDRRAV